MVCHPVMVRAESDDVSWYILTSLDPRLDTVLRHMKRELAFRDLAVRWD